MFVVTGRGLETHLESGWGSNISGERLVDSCC
jgi:hypothetical protein